MYILGYMFVGYTLGYNFSIAVTLVWYIEPSGDEMLTVHMSVKSIAISEFWVYFLVTYLGSLKDCLLKHAFRS